MKKNIKITFSSHKKTTLFLTKGITVGKLKKFVTNRRLLQGELKNFYFLREEKKLANIDPLKHGDIISVQRKDTTRYQR